MCSVSFLRQQGLADGQLDRVINVGGLTGIVTTLTEKHAGFGYAYLISLCLMVVAAALFQAGYLHFSEQSVAWSYP